MLTSNAELMTLIGSAKKIVASYPQEIKQFPLIVFEDSDSHDVAFSDNLPEGTSATVRVHVFSKTVSGFPKVEEIAEKVHDIFREDFWACTLNQDTADVSDNTRHRVMDFTRGFYSL